MRRPSPVPALLAAVALLSACPRPEDPCSNDNQKLATANLVSSWYLYPELLPAAIDLGAYAGPAEVLDALTANARAAGKDRHWSYTTTTAAQQAFFTDGTVVGFGISVLVRGSQLFVSQVYAGSAAAAAGFVRGDEVVAIGTADPLTPVAGLVASGTVGDAFGPATAGTTRQFDVIPLGANPPVAVRRTMTKGTYFLDPVPYPKVIDRTAQGLPPAGYLPLRAFISPAAAPLAAAVADFKARGVTDVIVDLRYNGGGLLETADLLSNLLGGGRLASDVMFALGYNASHQASNFVDYFAPFAGSLAPAHVAFLVTSASASASELVPNALAPWMPVALVGHQTYGKPVGQRGFVSSQCGLVVYLVSFRLTNSQGNGDYFGGLPSTGFAGCGVAADDDLTHETWDPAELQTAAALQWFAAPSPCAPLAVPLSAAGPAPSLDAYPEAIGPSEAQRHVRGLF